VALISGPNSSGKSVYLKQVGLLVYLAHLGSWLPCEQAVIGLTDRIFTRISSLESVSSQHSSFSLDLNQVSQMLANSTSRSLCLIDEFGKGTSPIDGIALLATTIKHFVNKPSKSLFVLHFTEVMHEDILSTTIKSKLNTFKMETYTHPINKEDIDGLNSLEDLQKEEREYESTPLFKLKLGTAESSEGIPCARTAGNSNSLRMH
jgi:DNA mismatch repair protein MSH5